MESGFPLVMLILPPVAALVALVARRWRRATAGVGLAAVGLLTVLLWLAAPGAGVFADNTLVVYGRELALTPFLRALFLFVYPALGVLFTLQWFRPAGRLLVPAGLAVLSPLAAALMIDPPALGAALLVAVAAVVAPALYAGRFANTIATWRYFLMTALAVAPSLLAGWFSAGQDVAWVSLLLASLLLLGGFPFHIWLSGLARRAPPAAVALVLGVMQVGVAVFVLTMLDATPAARASAEFQSAMRWSAALTGLLAAFLMSRAADWRELAAGALLLDAGFLLVSTLAPGAAGLSIALAALAARYLSLLLIALGLRWPGDGAGGGLGGFRTRPYRLALLVYGCLSLVGLPLTPGFGGRWAQLAVVAAPGGATVWPAALLVAALACAAWSGLRAAVYPGPAPAAAAPVGRGERTAALALLALAGLLGLFSNLLLDYATRIAGTF
jgi:formate hydrogenlyase subunit 3/multisubunit Na+/H+ antiporter MnhD subunit